jgi:hypothetical protein
VKDCVAKNMNSSYKNMSRPDTLHDATRYIPRASTLRHIDAFCVGIIAECNAITEPASKKSSLVKSLNFVRALVLRHLPNQGYGGVGSPSLSKPLTPATSGSPRPGGLKRGMAEDRDGSKTTTSGMEGLEVVEDEDALYYIAVDVLRWRWVGSSGQLPWAPSPVMLDR